MCDRERGMREGKGETETGGMGDDGHLARSAVINGHLLLYNVINSNKQAYIVVCRGFVSWRLILGAKKHSSHNCG